MVTDDTPKMTSRELLVDVAGEDHALHTVIARTGARNGSIEFACSCGVRCSVIATKENELSLRNVPLVAS